ncbi:penicillin-binding protein 1C [Rhabdochromatium marinum]|uniref:penicillin-binding protein 1C n=1 Tax=Rhabdochromatium marinum TaxID=48729 RepID=UPI001F5BFF60|nr:penicillin-binding protein 1C [Rhabdochromatium marinum]
MSQAKPSLLVLGLSALLVAGLGLLAVLSLGSHMQPAPSLTTPSSRLILDRDGRLLRALPVADGRWRLPLTLDDLDPLLIDLLLCWEDRRFLAHSGIDWAAMTRALVQLLRHGRIVSGGSTLSMQLVRLLEQTPTHSLRGKWQQLTGALALERQASKREILRAYLQHAGYGGNLEGVRSASLAYFSKEPRHLSPAQAALLVALPQSPERRRPDRHPQAAKTARNRVLARAAAQGVIDRETAKQAMAAPIPHTRQPLPRLAAHRSGYWARHHSEAPQLQLTLSAPLQRSLEQLAQTRATTLAPRLSLALMVVDHRSGDILASVGSAGYTDASRHGFIDMTDAVRSPGSTLKPLIYGLAFELGLAHPESLIEDRPSGFGHYAPTNFDGDFAGTVTVREALQRSLNVPAVTMLERVGPARLLARLRRAGVQAQRPGERPAGLAIALGGVGLRLRDLMALYTAIARGGQSIALREWIRPNTPPSARQSATQAPVLEARAAWYLSSILSGADAQHSGAASIAIKTGTSYGYRDAWALGFDGAHVVGVWVGRPDGAPVSELTGAGTAVPILIDAFTRLGSPSPLPPAPEGILTLSSAQLPPPLQRVESSHSAGQPAPRVQIAYPPDGARVDLELGLENHGVRRPTLALKARGGHAPFTWIINGGTVQREAFARSSQWHPDGQGFADILLIDAAGARASAQVLIE